MESGTRQQCGQKLGQSLSDGISWLIFSELIQGNLPRNNREKLVLLLWAIHLLRNVPNGPPTLDEMVSTLAAEARNLKTLY
jgi:hypothetical protein